MQCNATKQNHNDKQEWSTLLYLMVTAILVFTSPSLQIYGIREVYIEVKQKNLIYIIATKKL